MTLLKDPTLLPEERTAHLDTAHVGDIQGAWGSIRRDDIAPRSTWTNRLITLLTIMGPGLIVMVGDNDAGGISTYAQAGQNFGTSLLWVLPLLIPVLIVNQEMVVRLGLVTGVGHARLIFDRFGKFWGAFSAGDLFLLNFLTIVTEFIGMGLALSYFGVPPWISVPVGAALLIGMTVTGNFQRWEGWMFLFIATNFLAIPLALWSHPHWGQVAHDFVIPHIQGGATSTSILLIISIVGTTVAPWQLFFQQSNVVDKRLTPRWMAYERMDTFIGAFVVILGASAIMLTTAFAFHGTHWAGNFIDGGATAQALAQIISPIAGALFAIVLLNASIIGAAAVTLSTSYAVGDVFKINHSLHRPWHEARTFYGSYIALVVIAAAIVLVPNAPLGLIITGVQALAGILLPSATVFLLLLCNDRAVLGPWINRTWLNLITSVIVGVLVMLSFILAATTLFPQLPIVPLALILASILGASLLIIGGLTIGKPHRRVPLVWRIQDPATWHMPPIATLPPPHWSLAQRIGMLALRGYLVVAMLLLVVKIVQLALSH